MVCLLKMDLVVMGWHFSTIYPNNILAPGRCNRLFLYVIFKHFMVGDIWNISCEIALSWILENLIDDLATLM